jgi:hypothetical protein
MLFTGNANRPFIDYFFFCCAITVMLILSAISLKAPLADDRVIGAEQIQNIAERRALDEAETATTNYLSDLFPTVEVDYSIADGEKPLTGILVVAPLLDSGDDIENTIFNQTSIFHQDGRTTLNLGLGYRRLVMQNLVLLGVNSFYDYEFEYDHQRASLGAEFRTSIGEINANYYWGLSNLRTLSSGTTERALDGYDLEVGIPLPFINWATFYTKVFRWHGVERADLDGNQYSLKLNPPLGTGWAVEAIVSDREEGDAIKTLQISYDFFAEEKDSTRSIPWVGTQAYQLETMEDHRFEKVRRENRIVKEETTGGFSVIGF